MSLPQLALASVPLDSQLALHFRNFGSHPSLVDESAKRSNVLQKTVTGEDVIVYEDWEDAAVHGNTIWDGGLALGKFFAWRDARNGSIRDMTVLELGAGTGVTGLALARLGAKVTLTDNMEEVVALMTRNVEANDLGDNAVVRHLDWADVSTYQTDTAFDLVIAADVLYEGYGGPILARAFEAHIRFGSKTTGFFAFRRRTEAPLSFFDNMTNMGFFIERLEDGHGKCVGHTHGKSFTEYDGSCFVPLPTDGAAAAVQKARFIEDGSIQIFRLTRCRASPLGLLSDEGGALSCPPIWKVTANGVSRGGLLVRKSKELNSPQLEELLMKGARVAQVQVEGNRMSYRLVSGDGPRRGWVSLTFKGTPLLTRE